MYTEQVALNGGEQCAAGGTRWNVATLVMLLTLFDAVFG